MKGASDFAICLFVGLMAQRTENYVRAGGILGRPGDGFRFSVMSMEKR